MFWELILGSSLNKIPYPVPVGEEVNLLLSECLNLPFSKFGVFLLASVKVLTMFGGMI